MLKALFTSATGMKVQQVNVDVIANNLANVNTTGYKRAQADFQDLLYVVMKEPGVPTTSGFDSTPSGIQIGSGAELLSTSKIFTPGVLEPTDRELDVAIQGDGFFEVAHPNGLTAYTRDGALRVDSQGNLTTAQGFPLVAGVTISPDTKGITIAQDGTVTALLQDNSFSQVGNLLISRFPNPSGLRASGGNLFFETESSGAAQSVSPGSEGTGTLAQGFLERSNVDVVRELVSLITAQRAYEINSRAIRVGDEMLQEVNSLVR